MRQKIIKLIILKKTHRTSKKMAEEEALQVKKTYDNEWHYLQIRKLYREATGSNIPKGRGAPGIEFND